MHPQQLSDMHDLAKAARLTLLGSTLMRTLVAISVTIMCKLNLKCSQCQSCKWTKNSDHSILVSPNILDQ